VEIAAGVLTTPLIPNRASEPAIQACKSAKNRLSLKTALQGFTNGEERGIPRDSSSKCHHERSYCTKGIEYQNIGIFSGQVASQFLKGTDTYIAVSGMYNRSLEYRCSTSLNLFIGRLRVPYQHIPYPNHYRPMNQEMPKK
jgi:hypothetical protein